MHASENGGTPQFIAMYSTASDDLLLSRQLRSIGSSLNPFRRLPTGVTQLHQGPAHAVKLVNQVENYPHAFIVYAEIYLEFMDKLCSGNIDFGESHFCGQTIGYQPLLLDPSKHSAFRAHAGER
jgi:hypothetical protein